MAKRRILYPTLQGPPALVAAPLAAFGWYVPLSEPVRRTRRNDAGPTLVEASFPETVSLDRWFQPFSNPVRRSLRNVAIAGPAVLTEASFKETVSLDRWLQPLSEPTRRPSARATLPPAAFSPIVANSSLVTLDPAHMSTDDSLSNGNLTVTQNTGTAGNSSLTRSSVSMASGKGYFEYTALTEQFNTAGIGLSNANANPANFGSADVNSIAWYNENGGVAYNGLAVGTASTWAVGDVVAVAFDLGPRTVWFRNVTTGSTWNANALANPATGIGGFPIGVSGPLFASVTLFNGFATIGTINFGTWGFAGAVPAGFGQLTQTSEIVTFDKWLQPLSEPRRLVARARPDAILPPVQPAIPPETITVDKWLQPFAEPVRRRSRLASDAATLPPPQIVATSTVTVDKWLQPFAQPVRRARSNVASDPILVSPTPATSISWLIPFSEPRRRLARYESGIVLPPPQIASSGTRTLTASMSALLSSTVSHTAAMDAKLYQPERAPSGRTINITG